MEQTNENNSTCLKEKKKVVIPIVIIFFLLIAAIACLVILLVYFKKKKASENIPKSHNGEFQGKVVLVTGGSSGIGYETALEFARSGARVIIAARDSNPAWFNGTSAANRINSDSEVKAANGSTRFVKTDVSNGTSFENLFADILRNEKTLDIAVNNAGIGGGLGYINQLKEYLHTEHDPISNNLYGTVNCLIEETKYFISVNKSGVIINIASINGLTGTPMGALYGASKFGIASLTRSVALEFLVPDAARQTPRIRVNAVAPGLVDTSLSWQQVKYLADGKTQMWEGEYITPDSPLWQEYKQDWINELRGKRIGQPSDQAAMILFLASDAASYITGTVFNVDNGELA